VCVCVCVGVGAGVNVVSELVSLHTGQLNTNSKDTCIFTACSLHESKSMLYTVSFLTVGTHLCLCTFNADKYTYRYMNVVRFECVHTQPSQTSFEKWHAAHAKRPVDLCTVSLLPVPTHVQTTYTCPHNLHMST